MFRSTTARFILLAFALQFAVTCGALLFVQQTSQRVLAADQREIVSELQDELTTAWRNGGADELRSLIAMRLKAGHSAGSIILYALPDGKPISGNLEAWPTVIKPDTDWRRIDLYRSEGERPETMIIVARRLPDNSRLLTGHVIDASLRVSQVNERAILAAAIGGMAMAMLGALIFGRLLSRKIEAIAATAHAVREGELTQRVRTDGSGDAFDRLGTAINAMLDRIEALVSQLRMITDGMAHDLRSPVTRMKVLIERGMADTRDPDALFALERISAEAETLLRMLSTALQISRAEAGIGRDRFTQVDVYALLEDIAEIYGPLAEDSGFTVKTSPGPVLTARLHREFISQAIGNLIENALKYADGGQRIVLAAATDKDGLTLSITDDGPGIASERHEDALRRFGRLDPARHLPGSGLGLSLAQAVARLHDGKLHLCDAAPGLRVELRLGAHCV